MICPNCGTENDSEYIFCVNCGTSISMPDQQTLQMPAQQVAQTVKFNSNDVDSPSVATAFPGREPYISTPKSSKKWLVILLTIFLLLAGAITAVSLVIYFGNGQFSTQNTAVVLPGHLGLFAVADDKNSLAEISRSDSKNIGDLTNDNAVKLKIITSDPEFILYSDPNDIKVNDIKLIDLGSITDKGELEHINYQVALVDGKPEMKRLLIQGGLPDGKYAFAAIDGFFNEGKHRFWPFEISGSQVQTAKLNTTKINLELKPSADVNTNSADVNTNTSTPSPPKPIPTPEIPVGSRVAFCNASSVIVRDKASLNGKRINQLKKGQRVFVISYSDTYDNWNGVQANWAYIQTENGKRGWVFTPFISY